MPHFEPNSLAKASSAYLRSAMHQPVSWREWGDEAFQVAQLENKPILLDIGAVWCHWCHVMDRESYDDPLIAQIINDRFIAVKVDRDERPDIDSRYQLAVSAISGQGGWPLTAFLTPEGKPFYGGTYFPPDEQFGRPSFRRVLSSIADAFRNKRNDVAEQAAMVEQTIAQAESHRDATVGGSAEFSASVINAIVQSAVRMFDSENGGFGSAPKFAHPAVLDLLMDTYVRTGDEELRDVFVKTLENMARGGIYDQLAGGFHRYSVDERWVVPHFEKMCYDNSELLKNYVHAYQVTNSSGFAEVARDILRWMDEWLTDRERGGFYGSQDADYSMEDDGDYFTWSVAEADAALTADEAAVVREYFDINEIGDMHHDHSKNVLHIVTTTDEISGRQMKSPTVVDQLLTAAKSKMYAARLKRPTPYIDKTLYVSWNAMCISAYLEAARVLNLDSTKHFALRSLDRLLAESWREQDGLLHVIAYSDPQAERRVIAGLLDDYAFTVLACLDAYEATADLTYFNFAKRIADFMLEHFFDATSGGFFDRSTSAQSEKHLGVLGTKRKPFQDSPTPAGNAVAAIGLLRLHSYTNHHDYRQKAELTLEVIAGMAVQLGIFAATYGIAAVYFFHPHTEVIVLGSDDVASELYRAGVRSFQLGKQVLQLRHNQAEKENLPYALAESIEALAKSHLGRSVAILCSNFTCQPPVFDAGTLAHRLESH